MELDVPCGGEVDGNRACDGAEGSPVIIESDAGTPS
jgi:hypothetical protein